MFKRANVKGPYARKRYAEARRHSAKRDDTEGHEYKGGCLPQWAEPLRPPASVQKKSKRMSEKIYTEGRRQNLRRDDAKCHECQGACSLR